jgi:hypothetical protein
VPEVYKKLNILFPFVPNGSCRPLLSVNIIAKTSEQNHTNKTDMSKLHWGNIIIHIRKKLKENLGQGSSLL